MASSKNISWSNRTTIPGFPTIEAINFVTENITVSGLSGAGDEADKASWKVPMTIVRGRNIKGLLTFLILHLEMTLKN